MIATCTKWIEKRFSGFSFLIGLYELYYKKIVRKEIELANITSKDNILCIGGGAIPSTAVELANQTNANVHVIDVDNNAVECAQNVVKKLGLRNKISIAREKGEDIDISSYDVIHIALQVSPKEKVLKHIWNNAKEGNRIIVRIPKKILKPFYSNVSEEFVYKNANCIKNYSLNYRLNTMDKILLMVKN